MNKEASLKKVLDKKIVGADLTLGDAGIAFEDGSKLGINNKFLVQGEVQNTSDLIGQTIIKATEDEGSIRLLFSNGLEIVIDMQPEAWDCPEAVILWTADGDIIVWNP